MKHSISLLFLAVAAVTISTNGHPTSKNHVSAKPTATEIFRSDFSKGSLSAVFDNTPIAWGNHNAVLWASGGGMDVWYPKGSYSPSEGPVVGGFGLETKHRVTNTAIFRYSVFFPADFNFVLGGKLPGLYGGYPCGGGNQANDCFSTRLMWRDNGKGELYLYAKRDEQDQTICDRPGNYCGSEFGWSLNTGSFTFATGVWTDIEETVTLNTPGVQNGILVIKINGEEKIRYNNLVFRGRDYPNMVIDGMMVQTFFGGGSPPWATPTDQQVKFRDFVLLSE